MAGGQSASFAQGSVGKGITIALVGIAVTVSAGTVNPNIDGSVALTGQSVAIQQGTIGVSVPRALTGAEVTTARGTVGPVITPTMITGQAISIAQGFVSAAGESVTVNLSGLEVTVDQGDFSVGYSLVGQAVTVSSGTAAPGTTIPITGLSVAVSAGTIFPGIEADDTFVQTSSGTIGTSREVAITGVEVVVSQGDLANFPVLVGEEIPVTLGTFGLEREVALTGASVTVEQSSFGAPGSVALVGQVVTVGQGDVSLTGDKTVALSGESVSIDLGTTFASSLAFVFGETVFAAAQEIGPRGVELTGVEVVVGQGNLTAPRRVGGGGLIIDKPKPRRGRKVLVKDEDRESIADVVDKAFAKLKPMKKGRPLEEVLKEQLDADYFNDTIGEDDDDEDDLLLT